MVYYDSTKVVRGIRSELVLRLESMGFGTRTMFPPPVDMIGPYRTRKILLRSDPAPGMNRKRSSPAGSMQVRSPSKASSDGAVLAPFNPTFWSQNSVAHALSPSTRATCKSRDGEGIWQAGTMQQRSNCLKMLWVADSCWRQRSSIHVSFSILHGSLSAQGCSGTKSKSW